VSSQNNFGWLDEDTVLAIHEAQIAEHGGAPGVRDSGLLASALARPQNAAAYSDADAPTLASLYALGIVKNHPFIDGNKRVGAVLLETFLELHGFELAATDEEFLEVMLAAAAGTIADETFSTWVREHANPRNNAR
jgi:death-on-curing protein